jgi:serine/threonine protein kinase
MSLVGYQRFSVIGRVVGSGSFGVVFQAKVREKEETVAIKKVLQDDRFENREVEIMCFLDHPNIVILKHAFNFSEGEDLFYNLELEFFSENIHRVITHYANYRQKLPLVYVKLYMFQTLRALAYLHSMGICHRDIKPPNLLIDPASQHLKLGDFGSAKLLTSDKPSISYICSRYYRAPELLIGAIDYTCSIDMWSAGVILGELLIGTPFFRGENATEQLVEIIKVLGTPTRDQVYAMNDYYANFLFPKVEPDLWENVLNEKLSPRVSLEAVDLMSKLLVYFPSKRMKPVHALAHPFFDELKRNGACLPNGKPLPNLFNFQKKEFDFAERFVKKILPNQRIYNICRENLCSWDINFSIC